MHIVRAADAPLFDLPGVRFTALAAPSRGSAEICAWQLTVSPGLDSREPHTLDHEEVFVVTSGGIRVSPGGEIAGPGDAVVVPAGEPIQLANPGSEPAQVLVTIRAGFSAKGADGSDLGTPPWAQQEGSGSLVVPKPAGAGADLPPAPRTPACPPGPLPRQRHPRRMISSLQKSRTQMN